MPRRAAAGRGRRIGCSKRDRPACAQGSPCQPVITLRTGRRGHTLGRLLGCSQAGSRCSSHDVQGQAHRHRPGRRRRAVLRRLRAGHPERGRLRRGGRRRPPPPRPRAATPPTPPTRPARASAAAASAAIRAAPAARVPASAPRSTSSPPSSASPPPTCAPPSRTSAATWTSPEATRAASTPRSSPTRSASPRRSSTPRWPSCAPTGASTATRSPRRSRTSSASTRARSSRAFEKLRDQGPPQRGERKDRRGDLAEAIGVSEAKLEAGVPRPAQGLPRRPAGRAATTAPPSSPRRSG